MSARVSLPLIAFYFSACGYGLGFNQSLGGSATCDLSTPTIATGQTFPQNRFRDNYNLVEFLEFGYWSREGREENEVFHSQTRLRQGHAVASCADFRTCNRAATVRERLSRPERVRLVPLANARGSVGKSPIPRVHQSINPLTRQSAEPIASGDRRSFCRARFAASIASFWRRRQSGQMPCVVGVEKPCCMNSSSGIHSP
jgi:hypothetical protein